MYNPCHDALFALTTSFFIAENINLDTGNSLYEEFSQFGPMFYVILMVQSGFNTDNSLYFIGRAKYTQHVLHIIYDPQHSVNQ